MSRVRPVVSGGTRSDLDNQTATAILAREVPASGSDLVCLQRLNEILHVLLLDLIEIFLQEIDQRPKLNNVSVQANRADLFLGSADDRLAQCSIANKGQKQLLVPWADGFVFLKSSHGSSVLLFRVSDIDVLLFHALDANIFISAQPLLIVQRNGRI